MTEKTLGAESESQKKTSLDSTNTELSLLCRICGSTNDHLIPIFEGEGKENSLAERILAYLPITVDSSDDYPDKACYPCASTLLAFHDLYSCCSDADIILKRRIANGESRHKIIPPPAAVEASPKTKKPERSVHCSPSFNHTGGRVEPINTRAPRRATLKKVSEKCETVEKSRVPSGDETILQVKEEENVKSDFCFEIPIFEEADDRGDDKIDIELIECHNSKVTTVEGVTVYKCKVCCKECRHPSVLMSHMRLHTGNKPFVCHLCGKPFRLDGALKRHIEHTHMKIRKFSCNLCSKKFVDSQNLKHHMRIHTKETPYMCTLCGKQFKQSAGLYMHAKSHTDIFPFECPTCMAHFRNKTALTHHKYKHTGEKPYVCDVCTRPFRMKHDLSRHLQLHADGKPFSCTLCSAAFKQKRRLANHIRRIHNKEIDKETSSK